MKNRKGFTLVELLAVIVILGIIMMISIPAVNRWIDRGKAESDEGNKKTLVMAAQSYAQGNSESLPKAIGDSTIITAEELKNSNFLKEELVNSDKNICMDYYVKVRKVNQKNYEYKAYIYCEGDTITADKAEANPNITIFFYGTKNENGQVDDVKVSAVRITIDGGNTASKQFNLASYSYSISARYTGSSSDKIVEIFNSGNVDAGQEQRIIIEKSLADYTDITKVNDFVVTVEAYNSVGGYRKQSATSSYKDSDAPKCGKITGQANEGEWINYPHTRTISVECSDGDGSGCVKDVFTKTFDTEMEYGYITISDNAGNTTDCRVRVLHDWTKPSLKVTAYRTVNNVRSQESDPVIADQANPSVTLKNYYHASGGWMGKASLPNGMEYVAEPVDNIKLAQGRWYYNSGGIYSLSSPDLNKFTAGAPKNFNGTPSNVSITFTAAGLRRGKYTLTDAAGNSITVNIVVNIDYTNPSCSASKTGGIGSTSGVTVGISCTDGQSGCSSSNQLSYGGQKSSTSYTVHDVAGNAGSCGITITSYNCHCSDCYYGENTCAYGCDTCTGYTTVRDCTYLDDLSGGGGRYDCRNLSVPYYYDCHCSSCHTGHNTCRYGCDTCYK